MPVHKSLVKCRWFTSLLIFVFIALGIRKSFGTELCSDFRQLINGEVPIRYFQIGFSNVFRANQKSIPGWVYYEGAIQNDTFWIRNCTNSAPEPAIMLPGWLAGMSHSNYWIYSNDKETISPRDGSVTTPVEERAKQAVAMVRQGLGLGVQVLPGSLKTDSDNSFRAKVIRGTNSTSISGRFEVLPDGRPSRCEYKSDDWPNARIAVSYVYSERNTNNCLPAAVQVEAFNLLQQIDRVEYRIISCDLGAAQLSDSGYVIDSLTNLGGINLRVRDLLGTVVFRDGAIYNMDKAGKQTLVSSNWEAPPQNFRIRGRHTFIALLGLSTLPLLWFIARHYRSVSNKSASTK